MKKKVEIIFGWAIRDWGRQGPKGQYTARAGRFSTRNAFGEIDTEYEVWCTERVARKLDNASMGSIVHFHGFAECIAGKGEDFECLVTAFI